MTVAYDILARAKSLIEGLAVDRPITSGLFEATTIDGDESALAGAAKPYPVIIEPASLSWSWPSRYTTMAVDQRWDTIGFTIDVYISPHMVDPMATNEDIAEIAYEIRRTLSDPASWTAVTGFVEVVLGDCTVDAVSTEFEGTGKGTEFIYVIHQPVVVTYREDHT